MEVLVEIRFHWMHRMEKGVLQTEDEPIQLTCQRLSTLGDLFTTIATVSYSSPSPQCNRDCLVCTVGIVMCCVCVCVCREGVLVLISVYSAVSLTLVRE